MSYSPISTIIYNAAFTGALGGIVCNGAKPVDPNPLDYDTQTAIAGAWAQAFDIAWNSASANLLDESAATQFSAAIFENLGVWTDGVSLTAANIDTNAGLQDPKTGARYCNTV